MFWGDQERRGIKKEHECVIKTDVSETAKKLPKACLSVTKRQGNTWVMGWEGPVQTSLSLSCFSAKTTTLFTQTNTIIAWQPWPLLRLPLHANGPTGRQTPHTSLQVCRLASVNRESLTHLQRAQTPRIFQRLITIKPLASIHPSIFPWLRCPKAMPAGVCTHTH